MSNCNCSSQASGDKVADLFSDLDDLPEAQAVHQGTPLSQAESVDMFEDSEAEDIIYDRVADLFSSNDSSQQIQTGSDFESEPEVESVLSSL